MTPQTGVYPPDASTDVGKLRIAINDTEITADNFNGTAEYTWFGDATLDGYIAISGSVSAARAMAFENIAAILIVQARDITSDDLRVQMVARAEQFRRFAADIRKAANDGLAAADIFEVAGGSAMSSAWPEGYPVEWPGFWRVGRVPVV